MKELIRIIPDQIDNTTTFTCSARDLHRFLESGRQFTDWFRTRVETYGYKKGKDFNIIHADVKNSFGSRPAADYRLTIDMAKELAMVEQNGKGRLIRQYFIHHEKRSVELVPAMAAELLRTNPLWQSIKRYREMGLTIAEVARLVKRCVRTVRRHVRKMEALGLLVPPVNLGQMREMARQFRLPGMEAA